MLFNRLKYLWNKFETEDLVTLPLCDIFAKFDKCSPLKRISKSLFSGNVWKMINYTRIGNNSAVLAHSSESSHIMLTEAMLQRFYYEKVD